jgi:ATP-dependent Lon protease
MSFKGEWDIETFYLKGDTVKIPTYKYFNSHRIQNGQKYFVCTLSHVSCNLVYPLNTDEIYWAFLASSTNIIPELEETLNSEEMYQAEMKNLKEVVEEVGGEIKKLKKEEMKKLKDIVEEVEEEIKKLRQEVMYQEEVIKEAEALEALEAEAEAEALEAEAEAEANTEAKKVQIKVVRDLIGEGGDEDTEEESSREEGNYLSNFITEEEIIERLKNTQNKRKFRTKLNEIQQEIRVYKKQRGEEEFNCDLEDKIMLLDVNIQTKIFLLDKYESSVKNAKMQNSSDYTKGLTWFKTVTNIPFGKAKPFKISADDSSETINLFFENVRSKLDEKIYGLDYVKEEILEFLARKITNPDSKGHILALHGVAGTGKTKILKTLASALELPFHQINFGGMGDSSILTGHSETYISSKPGKIVEILSNSGCMNPIIYLDEIDKISESKQREINGVLTHMLDEEQNNKFQDNYLSNVDIDLSQVFFVIAFNDLAKVNSIVSDRMKIIDIKIPTIEDKIIIASKKMIPEIIDALRIKTKIIINDDLIRYIMLNKVNNEGGVRQMKKIFEKILNRINYLLLIGKMERDKDHVINKEFVDSVITINHKDNDFNNFMYT